MSTKRSQIDWLVMEQQIRDALRMAASGQWGSKFALVNISEALGTHTGRGYDYGYISHGEAVYPKEK